MPIFLIFPRTTVNYELRNAKHSRMPLKINYDVSNWNAAEISVVIEKIK